MWGGLSAKESCILLFSPAPPNNIWALMTPDFEYLEKNREIVEVGAPDSSIVQRFPISERSRIR